MKHSMRILTLLLAGVMLLGCLLPGAVYAEDVVDFDNVDILACDNTYVNTGNQRQDLVGVALTQVGYTEGRDNDTKYGTWYGLPYQAWCASFVSWCARQAEISTDILGKSALASPRRGYFDIPYYSGTSYTPQPGDLFFTQRFSHVGIVYYVEGEYFYCIEGNANEELSVDGFWVIINKRKISDYYFGVPSYEGADKDHTYVRGVESEHPHKSYFECTTCGDKYYTGYTDFVEGCGSCLGCGCTSAGAGYYQYLSDLKYPRLSIREGHGTSGEVVGGISNGASVRVLGTSDGWAYVEYFGVRGHVKLSNLTKYYGPPQPPVVSTDREDYVWDEDVTISWAETENAEKYHLELLCNGEQIYKDTVGLERSFVLENAPAGIYEARVKASNLSGYSEAGVCSFTVRDTYTVSFDARGGSEAPESQTKALGEKMILPDAVPLLEGFTFLGWTEDPAGAFAFYKPGDSLIADDDLTLYAVWKDVNAAPAALEITSLPTRTMFLVGEELDTTGMALSVHYSDGTGCYVTEGYGIEGFSSENLGTVTVTVSWEELTAEFQVQIVSFIPGDIDLNKSVDRQDVMALLWHISFPDQFPIESPADFNADGDVNRDDVMSLLWHISFPEQFPLVLEEQPSQDGGE